jgi:hypothetical protein
VIGFAYREVVDGGSTFEPGEDHFLLSQSLFPAQNFEMAATKWPTRHGEPLVAGISAS